MVSYEFIEGILFFFMTLIGICGNLIITICFSQIAYQDHKITTVEIILLNLAWANLIALLARSIPETLYVFGVRKIFDDIVCKIIPFLHISFRGHALCLTCFLSYFQCLSIGSTNIKWLQLKAKMQKYIAIIIIFFCFTSMVFSTDLILYSSANKNISNTENTIALGYCINFLPNKLIIDIIGYLVFSRDLLCVLVMSFFSVHILFVLYTHRQKVKGIRSSDRSLESTAEGQAAKIVILLVIMYALFFGIGTIVWFYQIMSNTSSNVAFIIRNFFSMCYSTFFPVVIFAFNRKIRYKLQQCLGRTHLLLND
ncbi:olfactory receptor class A-like protein 1 [Protopterus annectens]|uniref:olfactory receptor class A-like protein 1 n=1 Tax=Protopterus annectens TaxID=7888 RepID=UPI001CF95309|nr:olfactory receptor class A-like protein 1 [Protopterus annectens]